MTWKIIDASYTGISAADADAETSFSLGYLFVGQEEKWAFRIGNTGSATADYHISVSGVNTALMSGLQYSTDKVTYDYHAFVKAVPAGQISDTIYCKFKIDDDDTVYMTSGTVLMRVDE